MNRSSFGLGPVRTGALAIMLALGGCAVGPDFRPPAAPVVDNPSHPYTTIPSPAQSASAPVAGGASQRLILGGDIPALWWELFHSEPLDRLVRSALAHNPTLAGTQAALREAQENYRAGVGSRLLPSVAGQVGAARERVSGVTTGRPGAAIYDLYNASVNVSYTVDAFGANRRAIEGLAANVDYQAYQVEAAYLTLTANVVTTAIREASLRAQIRATNDVIASEEKSVELVQKQIDLGAVARGVVLTQRTLLAQTRATLPGLLKALEQTRHQLAVYAGELPGGADLPVFDLESLRLPEVLPVSLPSTLVRQRPDIRASEALLHVASAQVGVATANLYPQITLSGSLGSQAPTVGDLFSGSSLLWSLGAGLVQPIFNGGALEATRQARIAAYDQASAQYRQTVLNAFRDVADTLRALDRDAEALAAQAEAAALAADSLDLVNRQNRLGAVSYLAILDAQRSYQQTRIALAQAQAMRYADTAALFQALGGGWWNRAGLADISRTGADNAAPR